MKELGGEKKTRKGITGGTQKKQQSEMAKIGRTNKKRGVIFCLRRRTRLVLPKKKQRKVWNLLGDILPGHLQKASSSRTGG